MDLPVEPPYAFYFQFAPGYAPAAQDLDTTSDTPAIGVFAAPYDDWNGIRVCCSLEQIPVNRIPSQVGVTATGGLLVAITDARSPGDQVVLRLAFAGLFKSRLNPCTLPATFCGFASAGAWDEVLYVGFGTDSPPPPPPPTTGQPPPGSCLLEYNDALVPGISETCCYRQGGAKNACRSITQCNDASGPGCCLVYGTENTAGGSRCCLYESSELGDDPTECQALLAAP